MNGRWVINLSIAAEALPVMAVIARRTGEAARRWIAVAFAVWLAQDVILWWMSIHGRNNHWLIHLGNPVSTVLFLGAYAAWTEDPVRRRALQFAAFGYVLVWAGIFLSVEDPNTFSQYTDPLRALVLILVCAWALVRAVMIEPPPVWRSAIYWVSIGLLMDFGTGLILAPVSGRLTRVQPALVVTAFYIKAGINVVAYLLVTVGMLCKPRPSSTGAFSSRPPSPS
jgi:hypothetical protein